MSGHAGRAHAILSASGAHRWMMCPGSALLEAGFPGTTSTAAEEGTLAHEIAEAKVRHYSDHTYGKDALAKVKEAAKANPLWQPEMDRYTDDYLDYVETAAMAFDASPYIAVEVKVDTSQWIPDGFGSADCILIGGDTLHIIDLKYGKSPDGRVSAEHNPQLQIYALGAYWMYKALYPIKRVIMSIVQPRLDDGITQWTCSLDDLLGFGVRVGQAAKEALSGKGAYHPSAKACKYCRAKGACRARADYNVKLAFGERPNPDVIPNDKIGEYIKLGEDVDKWLSDIKAYALSECLAGRTVKGYKAVEGRRTRTWTDMDKAFTALKDGGVDEALLWERKPLTLAQVEKTVGKATFKELVGDYVHAPPGKPTLVPDTDKRGAITNATAAEAFGIDNNIKEDK